MLLPMLNAMPQLVTRIDDELAAAVDRLIAAGAFASRSDAVRRGLQILVEQHRRVSIASEIVEGYRIRPQTEEEVGWSDHATRLMIADEPW
jgi:Arc/MetJ-type ribon-helix-helix transcriptional regulator